MKKTLCLLANPYQTIMGLLLFSLSSLVFSDAIDTYLQCEMKKLSIPGLSLAVVKNGKIIKSKGYGFSNVELHTPATPETIYQSGSIGKQFTAMLVMKLVEKGKLRLNDKLNHYIKTAPESWRNITILNMLTHTSGLTRYTPDVDLHLDYTHEDIIRRLRLYPLDFEPGSTFRYSNVGYDLLGFVLEKVTGKSYDKLVKAYIFKPLHMDTAQVINDRDIIPNRASGYDLVNGSLKNQEYISPTFNSAGSGALYFTVLDLAKWDAALYTTTLLKQENMALLFSPVTLNNGKTEPYGLGWRLGNINGHRLVEHGGEWQGFTAFISRFLDDKLTVIIMTNLSGNAELGNITHHVAGLYNSKLEANQTKDKPCH